MGHAVLQLQKSKMFASYHLNSGTAASLGATASRDFSTVVGAGPVHRRVPCIPLPSLPPLDHGQTSLADRLRRAARGIDPMPTTRSVQNDDFTGSEQNPPLSSIQNNGAAAPNSQSIPLSTLTDSRGPLNGFPPLPMCQPTGEMYSHTTRRPNSSPGVEGHGRQAQLLGKLNAALMRGELSSLPWGQVLSPPNCHHTAYFRHCACSATCSCWVC